MAGARWDITTFVERSIGSWRSQRSVHHLAFAHFEAVTSTITVTSLSPQDERVGQLCQLHGVETDRVVAPFLMTWEGQSDWDGEISKGESLLVPVPSDTYRGKLLRDKGYAEAMPAVGEYYLTEDNTFVLVTPYDRAAAEEKIWFINDNVRCRVSLIKTSGGSGVVTASFSSEIKQKL
ncbi:MAG: phycobiliprotein lyase [Pseudanabaenaceae cyanobacterium SKYGB_i_bin29]|nr:phycobiliprotein lyase [Pseudanabaenaceae cyanobacterium SKYG29]MDW8422557.1 phycobiliprotein lyase [Pseudanabaenaceae cyanobacterium SKYGB_i_bin29]